jgi:hypothetical protein
MRIPVPPHFSFEATVESHGWYLLAPFRWDRKTKVLRRPEAIGDRVVDVAFRFRNGAIEITPAHDALKRAATRMFQLDLDTSDFIALAADFDAHRWVVGVKFGRLLCGSTLFEDVVKIIATTNTTWMQTKRMVSLLVEKCGRKSPLGLAAFPSPEDVAHFSAAELKEDCRVDRLRSITERCPPAGHGRPARLHRRRHRVPPLRIGDVPWRPPCRRKDDVAPLREMGTLEVSGLLVGAVEISGRAFAAEVKRGGLGQWGPKSVLRSRGVRDLDQHRTKRG